jgi:two-component system chemotaxis response regulator CheB
MEREKLVIIAASTGGPRVLVEIISQLPRNLSSSVVVVQHMLPRFIDYFAKRLQKVSKIPVYIGTHKMRVLSGSVVLAPGGRHLLFSEDKDGVYIVLEDLPPNKGVIPSADLTLISAAPLFMENLMGVILTGMGSDGVDGFRAVRELGGRTVVEDEESSTVYGMPKQALKMGLVDKVLTPDEVVEEIIHFSSEV